MRDESDSSEMPSAGPSFRPGKKGRGRKGMAAPAGAPPAFERTLNATGFMISSLDEISAAFVEFAASKIPLPALDIGAAFGVATHAALARGVTVVANDIEEKHLQILSERTPETDRSRLFIAAGSFPDELQPPFEQFSAILLSRVMHFFDGPQVERSVSILCDWLTPGGKVFVVVEASIFLNQPVLRQKYESQLAAGERWPGFVGNVKSLLPQRAEFVPDRLHYLSPEILTRAFSDGGFAVELADVFQRAEEPGNPDTGFRESVGLIARKA